MAAINRENHEDHPRNIQAPTTISPSIQEDYITQVSEKIEGRVTKKLCQEFSKTESCVLAALSRVDEFLLNPQAWVYPGPVLGSSRISNSKNQEKMRIVLILILILKLVSL